MVLEGRLECIASTPPNFVEVVVRGRFLRLERIASTPPNFVEVVARGRVKIGTASFSITRFCWGCRSEVLFWCIRRVALFKSHIVFSRSPTCATLRGMGE